MNKTDHDDGTDQRTPLRVLVVEDSADDTQLVLKELQRGGYEPACEQVLTAAALTAALARQPWEIVIADYRLPDFSGPAALAIVQASGLDLPFILVSGTVGDEAAAAIIKAGAADYLLKDRLGRLGPAVGRALEAKRFRAERRRTEQQLHLQATALQTAANAVVITDPQGTILWVNPAFTSLTGYSLEEAVGQNPRLLKSGKHGPAFYKHLWDTLLAGQTWRGSFTNRRKDGSLYHDEHMITPVRAEDGALTHFIAIMNDVTDRRQAEAARQVSEVRYRTLFEHAPDGIVISDTEGRYLDANASMCRLLGYPRDELIGRHAADIVAPEEIPNIASALGVLKARSDHQREWQLRRKDGSVFPAEVIATMMPDGHLLGMVRDITARKRAEQRIEHLNRVYAVLSDINQTIVREKDPRAMLEAACRIAVEKGRFRMAWIGLLDTATGRLQVAAHAGATADTLDILRGLLADAPEAERCAFTWDALRTGAHGVCNDIKHDPAAAVWREAALQRDYRALAVLPLKQGDRVVGTFSLYADVPGFFDAEEMLLLDELAMDIGFALEVGQNEAERWRVEEALRESERHFRLLYENSPYCIHEIDLAGRLLLMNRAGLTMLGVPEEGAICGMPYLSVVADGDRERIGRLQQLAFQGQASEFEFKARNGLVFQSSFVPITNAQGAVVRLMGLTQDITERAQAAEFLQRRAEELERFHRLSVGRELQMIELKKEVNELARLAGRTPPHDLSFLEPKPAPPDQP